MFSARKTEGYNESNRVSNFDIYIPIIAEVELF